MPFSPIRFSVLTSLALAACSDGEPRQLADELVQAAGLARSGSIYATPNPCVAQTAGSTCTSHVSWNVTRGSNAYVFLDLEGKTYPFSFTGSSGASDATWIVQGKTYSFKLYADEDRTRLLDDVTVTATGVSGQLSATPNPCVVQAGRSTCSSLISWNVSGQDTAYVFAKIGQRTEPFAFTQSTGSQEAPWLGIGKSYSFELYADPDRQLLLDTVSPRAVPAAPNLGTGPPTTGPGQREQLARYWPYRAQARSFQLLDRFGGAEMMEVANTVIDDNRFLVWFRTADEPAGSWKLEQFRYCADGADGPWLFLDQFLDLDQGQWQAHSVQTTKALFTPQGGATRDLVADGTYARCGGHGQPYLRWNQDLRSYHLQVWGTINKDKAPNSNWRWFWDLRMTEPKTHSFSCLGKRQTVRAIQLTEAWWDNFSGQGQWWLADTTGTSGEVDANGIPTGRHIQPTRKVWHAEGQLPYFAAGGPTGAPTWCTNQSPIPFAQPSTPPAQLLGSR